MAAVISFEQGIGQKNVGTAATNVKAFGSSVTAGNKLIALCSYFDAGSGYVAIATDAIADSLGNTWTRDAEYHRTAGNPAGVASFSCIANGSGTCTVTFTGPTGAGGYLNLCLAEFSVADGTWDSGINDTESGNGSDNAPTTLAVTATSDTAVGVALVMMDGKQTITEVHDLIAEDEDAADVGTPFNGQYLIGTTNESYSWSLGGTQPWTCIVAVYGATDSVGGGGLSIPIAMHHYRMGDD